MPCLGNPKLGGGGLCWLKNRIYRRTSPEQVAVGGPEGVGEAVRHLAPDGFPPAFHGGDLLLRNPVAYAIFEARRGRTAAEIARKTSITRQAYGRLEDPKASLTVTTLEKFAKAVGKKLEINFV